MFALKLLMAGLGVAEPRCAGRTAPRSHPRHGRASYIFNPTIAGIEEADAILLVGTNPRLEALDPQRAHPQALARWRRCRSASSASRPT